MRKWARILPLFIIVWLARKRCEKFTVHEKQWHLAFEDVLVKSNKE